VTDISLLFDSAIEPKRFTNSSVAEIPPFGSIIYTVFLDATEFIYVGIGGLAGKTVQERKPRSRLLQHTQGRRSGDQFCIYIQDFYVIPTLIGTDHVPVKGYLDKLTKQFIQTRLSYRYVVVQTDDSDKVVRRLERDVQAGAMGYPKPKLNGTKNE
jgi:hypothetical protein